MDKRTVFLDNIILPRALVLHRDGVLVGAPPHLWFCRDTNGDGKLDASGIQTKQFMGLGLTYEFGKK
jgi:hypothetical protein